MSTFSQWLVNMLARYCHLKQNPTKNLNFNEDIHLIFLDISSLGLSISINQSLFI